MLNQGRFFIEVANLVMPRVLPNPAARKSTPTQWEKLPESDATFPNIEAIIRYVLVCLIINYKKDNTTNVVLPSIEYCMFVLKLILQNDHNFLNRMRVVLKTQTPTDESIYKHLNGIVRGILQRNGMDHIFGVIVHDNFSKDCKLFHTNTEDFQIFFDSVWNGMFPSLEIQKYEAEAFFARQRNEVLFKSARMPCTNQSPAAIVARTAVTFTAGLHSVVPTLVSGPLRSAPPPLDESVEVVRVLPDPPPRDDATDLILAGAKADFQSCVKKVVTMAAESFAEGNLSIVMATTGALLDAQVLTTSVACDANEKAFKEDESTFAALEVVELVNAAAEAGKSLFLEPPNLFLNSLARSVEPVIQPSSPVTIDNVPVSWSDNFLPESSEILSPNDAIPSDAESAHLFAAINSPIPPGQTEVDRQIHAIEAGGPLSVIPKNKDGADQSGKTSPLPPNGEGRAHFTTFAQSPQKCVEDRALGAQHKSSLRNLGRIPPSGQNGTFLTHDFPELLASLSFSSKSSFTPPTNQIVPSPELTDTGVGGAQLLGNPIGNPPGIVLSTVGVSRNTHADQPSFPPKSDVGGPPVQVLAKSGKPPGSFGGADQPKTQSRLNLLSSCIPGRKTSSASQSGNSSSSWLNIFHRHKSNRVNPNPGQTNDTCPPVEHSPGKIPSESAATTTTSLPSSISPLGGNIGGNQWAHSPGDPPGFVPPPAPSSSSELRSAATPALSPQSCPSGHNIGGIERNGVRSQFVEFASLVLMMKYATAQQHSPSLMSHPCVPGVPNLLALQARVA